MSRPSCRRLVTGCAATITIALAMTVTAIGSAGSVTAAHATPATRSPATGTGAQLQAGLDDLHSLGVTGTQGLLLTRQHGSRARSGLRDLEAGSAMPVDGSFRIGSTTKTFIAVVVLQLVGEGRLSLDDTVEHWLPGLVSGNGNDGSKIYLRQLLQHTSGVPNYADDITVLDSAQEYYQHRFDHYRPSDLVALAMKRRPTSAPGTRWAYSPTNYVLAGMIIEKATGTSWAAQVRSRILRPLGLHRTFFPGDRPTLPRPHATTYQQYTADGPLIDTTVLNPTVADASGGLVSTTTDVARFWMALQQGRLLRPQQQAQMQDTVLAETLQGFIPGIRYGLGIFWFPNKCGGYWFHPGDLAGTTVLGAATSDGSRTAVVYLTAALAPPAASEVRLRGLSLVNSLVCPRE